MRSIPFPGNTQRQSTTAATKGATGGPNVVSLASVRARRKLRSLSARRDKTPASPLAFEQIDLEGLDFDRLTPGARQLYWFNLNNYARHLYASAADVSAGESGNGYSPVTTDHMREAESKRLGAVRHREAMLGAGFVLDALQILGAATCGALATRPAIAAGYGAIPLVVALGGTIAIFLLREFLYARAEA
jgi:hypothetical protein